MELNNQLFLNHPVLSEKPTKLQNEMLKNRLGSVKIFDFLFFSGIAFRLSPFFPMKRYILKHHFEKKKKKQIKPPSHSENVITGSPALSRHISPAPFQAELSKSVRFPGAISLSSKRHFSRQNCCDKKKKNQNQTSTNLNISDPIVFDKKRRLPDAKPFSG